MTAWTSFCTRYDACLHRIILLALHPFCSLLMCLVPSLFDAPPPPRASFALPPSLQMHVRLVDRHGSSYYDWVVLKPFSAFVDLHVNEVRARWESHLRQVMVYLRVHGARLVTGRSAGVGSHRASLPAPSGAHPAYTRALLHPHAPFPRSIPTLISHSSSHLMAMCIWVIRAVHAWLHEAVIEAEAATRVSVRVCVSVSV